MAMLTDDAILPGAAAANEPRSIREANPGGGISEEV
jgi:hypothetical protein